MPEITIITAARTDTPEKVQYLHECLKSVQGQDFQDWEHIIVDDDSPLLLDEAKLDDPRFLWARAHGHQGTARCRNVASAAARGRALLALDADDMLPPGALSTLHRHWLRDESQFVYGDVQWLENGMPGQVVRFADYTFQRSLNPRGTIPVTALHSVKCWQATGGWRPELHAGLEDVAYWIAAGASGHCGSHVSAVTLLYRRHPESRTQRMRAAGSQASMQNMIREMYPDLYEGRLPMGCCGGKSKPLAQPTAPRISPAPPPTMALAADARYSGMQQVSVRYNGARGGSWGMIGDATGVRYEIRGTGHVFPVWAADVHKFHRAGRGKDFTVGVPAPEAASKPEPVVVKEEPRWQPPVPELATVVRRPQPETFQALEPVQPDPPKLVGELDGVPEHLMTMLADADWTLRMLADAEESDLTPYPGIGPVIARRIIREARTQWSSA